ncbi:MAG TPA: AAA family ATPase [Anaeromyxobacteraceae bacterium]|nr:AAA family ATPase [Anaeromyxobacteraceae bacterium]
MSILEDHFKLHRPPFPQSAEASALLQHQSLKDALDRLRFAVDRDGIALFTAEAGCGKSTILSCLARDLDATAYLVVYASLSTLGPFSLLSSLVSRLGRRPRRFKGETAQDLVAHLRSQSKRAIVVIDEAHLLPDESLEDLRLLTGESLDKKSPFALILAGQPLLRERLAEPQHYALAQRVTVRVRIRPLTDSEVALFLDKHLRATGAKSNLFEPDAVTLVFQHSRGVPRLAQNLALGAMLAAASGGKKLVDADAVQQALLELEGS